MELICFPKYTEKGPSSRYRIYQYLDYFEDYEINIYPFFDDNYTPGFKFWSFKGMLYLSKSYSKRLVNMLKLINSDKICLVQYEFTQYLPFFKFFFKIFNISYIVDYDDAVFHDYDQHKNKYIRMLLKNKIEKVIKNATHVITGSPYLTRYAKKYNNKVTEIPTSIDFGKYYEIKSEKMNTNTFVIGWIGSKTTSKNILPLIGTFEKLISNNIKFELHLIGFDPLLQHYLKHLPVKFITWDSNTEITNIKNFTVGIMPLDDNLFNKGKCAFKLIQYMACGISTISSSFEANKKVDRNSENLFVKEISEWEEKFIKIYKNRKIFDEIGIRNIEVVKSHYSLKANVKCYLDIFTKLKKMN